MLPRDRLASLRAGARPRGAAHAAALGAARTGSSRTRSSGTAPALWRRAPFYGTHTMLGDVATATIQSPIVALAWEAVADASRDEDPGFATEALDELRLHYDWLDRERDPDGDGLLTIILPDESGLDDSPKYDGVFRWMRHDLPGYFWLVERHRRLGYRAADIVRAATSTSRTSSSTCSTRCRCGRSALPGGGGRALDRPLRRAAHGAPSRRCSTAASTTATGLFFDLAGPRRAPRAGLDVVVARAARAARAARRRAPAPCRGAPARTRGATGRPSGSRRWRWTSPRSTPRCDRFRTWRGPSWMNTAWLLAPALRELGHDDEADRIVALARAGGRGRGAGASTTTR